MQIKRFEGENAKVQNLVKSVTAGMFLAAIAVIVAACGGPAGGPAGSSNPNETAATVNGKVIKMEDVERALKAQATGQDAKMSPLELASARLQVLSQLIEQEVMFQKAEKEKTVPTDEEVTGELNKQKTQSGKSADQIEKEMRDAGVDEAAVKEQIKKAIAIQKLYEKITSPIDAPKDAEIEQFYAGNKEAFVKKKGVKLAAIVIDPANSGEGDVTIDEPSAVAKANEIINQLRTGGDFATIARDKSEDQSRFQGGDLGYLAEADLQQAFGDQTAAGLMDPQLQPGKIVTARSQGKLFVLKLQERSDKDEALTLESPGVRQQVIDSLINARKQLLQASYQAIAMNEAKIDNLLAKKVVANPNELSGARPASVTGPSNANTGAPVSNANAAAPAANNPAKPAANTPVKPAANAAPAKPAANAAPANK